MNKIYMIFAIIIFLLGGAVALYKEIVMIKHFDELRGISEDIAIDIEELEVSELKEKYNITVSDEDIEEAKTKIENLDYDDISYGTGHCESSENAYTRIIMPINCYRAYVFYYKKGREIDSLYKELKLVNDIFVINVMK